MCISKGKNNSNDPTPTVTGTKDATPLLYISLRLTLPCFSTFLSFTQGFYDLQDRDLGTPRKEVRHFVSPSRRRSTRGRKEKINRTDVTQRQGKRNKGPSNDEILEETGQSGRRTQPTSWFRYSLLHGPPTWESGKRISRKTDEGTPERIGYVYY